MMMGKADEVSEHTERAMTCKLQHELSEGNLLLFSDIEFWVFARDERENKPLQA